MNVVLWIVGVAFFVLLVLELRPCVGLALDILDDLLKLFGYRRDDR